MPIYNFDHHQQYSNIDRLPDNRSDMERLNSPLSLYDHDNPDIAYAERLAEETINLAGGWITVFKRTRNQANRDDVWEEDADPTYFRQKKIKGRFVPAPVAAQLTRWGADAPTQMTIQFSRATVLKEFGRDMIAEGDVLLVPHNTLAIVQNTDLRDGPANKIDTFRVISSSESGNFRYRWLYWTCVVENVTGDKTIQVEFNGEKT